jgi:hypothetical protein
MAQLVRALVSYVQCEPLIGVQSKGREFESLCEHIFLRVRSSIHLANKMMAFYSSHRNNIMHEGEHRHVTVLSLVDVSALQL